MNVLKRARLANPRVTRTFQLAPATRAIRAVLFGSTVMLALAGPGLAYAGTCATDEPVAPNVIACNGSFTDAIPSLYDPLVDLTLVVGDSAPTSVIPAAGTAGISISSQANVSVVTHADITTVGADGVHIDGATSATLNNDGTISTEVTLEGANAIDVTAIGDITIINSGELQAFSTGDSLSATAVTATATSDFGNVTFDNLAGGVITANTTGYASAATGISVTTSGGSAVVNNFGNITATATSDSGPFSPDGTLLTYDTSAATGVLIHSGGDATVVNAGSISAANQTQSINLARAAGVAAYSFNGAGAITVTNTETGSIAGTAGLTAFGVIAVGGSNYFDLGTTGTVNNAGSISAEALGMGTFTGYSPFATSLAIGVFSAHTNNTGEITATAHGDAGTARGIWGSGSLDNSGTIFADSSDGAGGTAEGVIMQAIYAGDVTVNNSGSIIASGSGAALGVHVLVIGADLNLDNSGTIANIAVPDVRIWNATGIQAAVGVGDLMIVNSGDITLQCGNKCYGMNLYSSGNMVIDNSGAITLAGKYYQQGILAAERGGAITITNSGSISVDSNAGVAGVGGIRVLNLDNVTYSGEDISLDDQTTTITNSGSISAVINALPGADYLPLLGQVATAVYVYSQSGAVNITNSGSLTAESYSYSAFAGGAVGINAAAGTGDITIGNTGSIVAMSETSSVYEGGIAAGIQAFSGTGAIDITNSGTISAVSISNYASDDGQTQALGVAGFSTHGDVTIKNGSTGVISADASTLVYNTAAAYGTYARTTAGNLSMTNDGSISANASSLSTSYVSSYGQTTAVGMDAVNLFGDSTTISNGGAVSAAASTTTYGAAHAFGIRVYASSPYAAAVITNAGTISATAHADNHSDVYDAATVAGLAIANRYGGTTVVSNSGAITADASSVLSSRAVGVSFDGNSLDFRSNGSIDATATADEATGTALATGLSATGGQLSVILEADSTLTASGSGYDGTAIGLLIAGDTVNASNAGAIGATFSGGVAGHTYGAIVVGSGDLVFTNTGAISAAGPGQAVGVVLSSDVSTVLINNGSIAATSAAGDAVAVLTGDSADTLSNSGTITGAVVTAGGDDAIRNNGSIAGQLMLGDGNDRLTNNAGGSWQAVGISDLGAGDDLIINAGTIALNAAVITFGDFTTPGNAFDNSGRVAVSGLSAIDLGAQNQFTNSGIIDFHDGAADDVLALTGDFTGSGHIAVDVSGLHNSADMLKIDGSVAPGSSTSINVYVDARDVPTTATGSIAVVEVTGSSTAQSFVMGDLFFDEARSFLTLGAVGLEGSIDASNATSDIFSVDLAVTGLSDMGTLAAAIAPGAQRLMDSEIGTLRQRMGVIDKTAEGLSFWLRAFQDSGSVRPGTIANNFGQGGNFDFDQNSSGQEIGIDYGLSSELSMGLLLGKAKARLELNGASSGVNKLDGDTFGVYGTWISPSGFYLDASFRRMSFDAKLTSAAGETRTSGEANAFNVEAGYAWTIGDGYKVEPQLQYTRTTVDDTDTLDGALAGFTPEDGASSRGRLGVAAFKSYMSNSTAWTPYIAVSVVREFDGENDYSVNDNFFGATSTKGTSTLVEGGLNVRTGNFAVFGGANWQDGGALESMVGGQLGLRYSW